MLSSPRGEAKKKKEKKKIQCTVITGLRVNDGKITSEMLRDLTDFTAEMRAEMKLRMEYQRSRTFKALWRIL